LDLFWCEFTRMDRLNAARALPLRMQISNSLQFPS
jgi:hypothetical protein